MQYTVVIERSSSNYSAYVPDLPGCVATGRTEDDVVQELQEAIALHIESLRAHGEPVPGPTCRATVVDVAAATA